MGDLLWLTMRRAEKILGWASWEPVFPSPGLDSCPACHSWTSEAGSKCPTCVEALTVLPRLAPMLPITLFAKPSPMRDALTEYKCAGGARQVDALAGMLAAFLDQHGTSLVHYFGSEWDIVVPVPSTQGRSGNAVAQVLAGAGVHASHRLRPTGTPGQHRRYDLSLFVAAPAASAGRVLLVEDAYVSGARAQTAAATLRAAGTGVAGILALGRRVNPDFNDCARLFWHRRVSEQQTSTHGFSWLSSAGAQGLS
jgi:predicted amidophosphoribosyltransferase